MPEPTVVARKSFLKVNSVRDYETLDAIVVCGSLILVGGIVYGLFVLRPSSEVLPVISSLATAILGLPVAYGAFRWGNNVGAKAATEAASENSKLATAALAQTAGATPPVLPTAETDAAASEKKST